MVYLTDQTGPIQGACHEHRTVRQGWRQRECRKLPLKKQHSGSLLAQTVLKSQRRFEGVSKERRIKTKTNLL